MRQFTVILSCSGEAVVFTVKSTGTLAVLRGVVRKALREVPRAAAERGGRKPVDEKIVRRAERLAEGRRVQAGIDARRIERLRKGRAIQAEIDARKAAREEKKTQAEAAKNARERERIKKLLGREAKALALQMKRDRAIWLAGTPVVGDDVLVQRVEHGRRYPGKVLVVVSGAQGILATLPGAQGTVYKVISPALGTHYYEETRIKRRRA